MPWPIDSTSLIKPNPKYKDVVIDYEGGFQYDSFHGHGKALLGDGATYIGGFSFGLFDQHGVMYQQDGKLYIGDFCTGRKEGHGLMIYNGTSDLTFALGCYFFVYFIFVVVQGYFPMFYMKQY